LIDGFVGPDDPRRGRLFSQFAMQIIMRAKRPGWTILPQSLT
jgi:hypothetical protein